MEGRSTPMTIAGRHLNLNRLLSIVEYRATARLAAVLEPTGARVDECRVLQLLSDTEGHPMAEVAEAVMLPPPTVTRLIDRMVSDNLVYRRADESDRRRLLVFVTARGTELHRKLDEVLNRHEDYVAAVLGQDAKVLADLLLTVLAGFDQHTNP